MKKVRVFVTILLATICTSLFAQAEKTDSIKVYGNCGMCKNRIEKAVKAEGVKSASWDPDLQVLVVTYDAAVINNDAIQKKIAAVGHDTEKYKAPDEVYKKLHGCCKYERKPSNN